VPNAKPELTGVGNGERPAPHAVKRLVDHFDRERKVYQSSDYKEEQLRAEFLNPFFSALGWDMDNKAGWTEHKNQRGVLPHVSLRTVVQLLAWVACAMLIGTSSAGCSAAVHFVRPDIPRVTASLGPSFHKISLSHPLAAMSGDGSVWLVWSSTTFFPAHMPARRDRPDLTFCQLTGPDGRVLVPAKQVWSSQQVRDSNVYSVRPFDVCAMRDGSVVIMISEYPVGGTGGSPVVRFVHVSRAGKVVSSNTVECAPSIGQGTYRQAAYRSSFGPFWPLTDSRGRMHEFCLSTWSRGQLAHGGYLTHVTMDACMGTDRVRRSQVPTHGGPPGSVIPLYAVHRPDLMWLSDNGQVGMALINDGTLLVAGGTGRENWDTKSQTYRYDSLRVQRFSLRAMTLQDSFTVDPARIAGGDWPTLPLSRAMLLRTDSGFTFFLPTPGGAASFCLDRNGRPIAGGRSIQDVRPFTDYRGAGQVRLDVKTTHEYSPKGRWPISVDVFAFDRNGRAYSDCVPTAGPPYSPP
jgi:hypothetical protein